MEQLFIRLLYEDWDERKYRFHLLEKDDEKNAQKGNREWFHDLELYCAAYEQREISHEEVYLENTKTLLVGHVLINTYLRNIPIFPCRAKFLCSTRFYIQNTKTKFWENKYPIRQK